MEEGQIKHLEMIQGVVARMSSHGIVVKGWAVTLVAAVMALAAGGNVLLFCIIAIGIVGLFGYLDGYYLQQERLFRCLFEAVRKGERAEDPFTMSVTPFKASAENRYWRVFWSARSVWAFYLALLVGPLARALQSACT